MLEPPRRPQRLSVALPASFTRDIPHLREKTGRVGIIARALAIFRVDEVVVYNDGKDRISKQEGRLFEKLLVYQETPQYMRRELFTGIQTSSLQAPFHLYGCPATRESKHLE